MTTTPPIEIALNGPGKNALGMAMMESIINRLAEANGAPALITGTGDAFSAGLDLKELAGLDSAGIERFLRTLEQMVEAIFLHPGPTVAFVNGHAVAGGSVVALCCDRIVCAENPKSKIGLNEVALGLRFPPVTLAMIRSRIAPPHLNEVILGARLHDPAGAERLGLVDERAADISVARERLAQLAAHPAPGYGVTKRDLREPVVAAARSEERFLSILPVWTSPEFRARVAAALKR